MASTSDKNEEEMSLSGSILDRSSRRTRGKRMTKLLDDELEEDEVFWNQDALKEDDVNYQEEGDAVDVFDSDFDEDEPEPDEDVDNGVEDRERKRKRLVYPGKQPTKKKNKKKVLSKLVKSSKDEMSSPTQESSPSEQHDVPDELEGERSVRKSTRTSVVVRQAEREAIRAAMQATTKPIKKRKEGEEKRMTQEEMLLEAAQTGQNFLEFSRDFSFQTEICTTCLPYPEKAVCAITGLPAKYRDPKTGLPYATKEAFKIIRQRFSLESKRQKNEKREIGFMVDSISGQGFLAKRKRSETVNRDETSYLRYWARFRSIPALENEAVD
ncbi:hypothetical protein IFM89_027349 [Coptis chinensis]|uniref:Vps72/YL1 C-terminal domain-containing protein n=1 Tax=Coptis chinensis TaxID=261450 RepID=A0A835HFY3_9MAGN|nr:hypothetical protein IFM89_027349 [Coptis chinensis]